jgi:hypothetical protein
MTNVQVLDSTGKLLSPTNEKKAWRLVRQGKATVVNADPLTIRLAFEVDMPQPEADAQLPGQGKRMLLHICCAPCATYTVQRLRDLAFEVTGLWYNPNVHPFSEHERRRETLAGYAARIDLPMLWEAGYDLVDFMQRIHQHETDGTRCKRCYHMRLEQTAAVAAREQFDAFTTTLLISPYQDQETIRLLGTKAGQEHDVPFFFENFRRGWADHYQMVRDYSLYSQRYCGCLYSEWEALDENAATRRGDT